MMGVGAGLWCWLGWAGRGGWGNPEMERLCPGGLSWVGLGWLGCSDGAVGACWLGWAGRGGWGNPETEHWFLQKGNGNWLVRKWKGCASTEKMSFRILLQEPAPCQSSWATGTCRAYRIPGGFWVRVFGLWASVFRGFTEPFSTKP